MHAKFIMLNIIRRMKVMMRMNSRQQSVCNSQSLLVLAQHIRIMHTHVQVQLLTPFVPSFFFVSGLEGIANI